MSKKSDPGRPASRAMRYAGVVLVAVLALTTTGCTQIDNFLASIPTFAFMRESPALDPYEAPRPPPENSVPFESPAGDVLPPQGNSDRALREFGATTQNPISMDDEAALARGQELYVRYCYVCHGSEGLGRETGPVTNTGAYPPVALPLATGTAPALSDGYIYGTIRVGRGLMPAYGGQIPHMDRWRIVNYVRVLQQAAEAGEAEQ